MSDVNTPSPDRADTTPSPGVLEQMMQDIIRRIDADVPVLVECIDGTRVGVGAAVAEACQPLWQWIRDHDRTPNWWRQGAILERIGNPQIPADVSVTLHGPGGWDTSRYTRPVVVLFGRFNGHESAHEGPDCDPPRPGECMACFVDDMNRLPGFKQMRVDGDDRSCGRILLRPDGVDDMWAEHRMAWLWMDVRRALLGRCVPWVVLADVRDDMPVSDRVERLVGDWQVLGCAREAQRRIDEYQRRIQTRGRVMEGHVAPAERPVFETRTVEHDSRGRRLRVPRMEQVRPAELGTLLQRREAAVGRMRDEADAERAAAVMIDMARGQGFDEAVTDRLVESLERVRAPYVQACRQVEQAEADVPRRLWLLRQEQDEDAREVERIRGASGGALDVVAWASGEAALGWHGDVAGLREVCARIGADMAGVWPGVM